MSGDEYDDDLSDDEFEERLKSPANEALKRLRARERPTEADVRLAEPFYEKRANDERIPYLIVEGGLSIGHKGILYPDYRGGQHVRSICQCADRIIRQDQCISPRELDSGGTVGSGGLLYSGDREGNYDSRGDDDDNWGTLNQHSAFEGAIKPGDKHLYVAEAKKLVDQGYTAKTNELLKFYEETIYQGQIKNADPEPEKIRQRVSQNIKNFYEMLEGKKYGNDESRTISAYFRKHIKYRHGDYWYMGKWRFRYF